MRNHLITQWTLFACTLAYPALFWKAAAGMNVLAYTMLILGALWLLQPECRHDRRVRGLAFMTLLTALAYVATRQSFAWWMQSFGLLATVGYAQRRELRFLGYALLMPVVNLIQSPLFLARFSSRFADRGPSARHLLRVGRQAAAPVLIIGLFLTIYLQANARFAELAEAFWTRLIHPFRGDLPWSLVGSVLVGSLLAVSLLAPAAKNWFARLEAGRDLSLTRRRKVFRGSMLALKRQYQSGQWLLWMLNLLLLTVNATDLYYVWFRAENRGPAELSQYVHQGTYLLIGAILLAAVVLLGYFRRNLHFYPHNQTLKALAYAWIGQNAVLSLSVAMRNYRYIEAYGLAYKRIGVFLFLACTVAGLIFLFLKVRDDRTFFYLQTRTALAVYCLLAPASMLSWDTLITRHNLLVPTQTGIDLYFLIEEVPDTNLSLLFRYRDRLIAGKSPEDQIEVLAWLDAKRRRFHDRTAEADWRSWTWPDARNRRLLPTITSK